MNKRRAAPTSRRWLFAGVSCLGLYYSLQFQKAAAETNESVTAEKTVKAEPSGKLEAPQFAPRYAYRKQGRTIQGPLRVESTGDRLFVSETVFPSGGEPQALELPEHLGGGFVFFQPASAEGHSATNIYRAERFTSELTPLSQLPYAVLEMRAGFDRVFALGSGLRTALDPKTGELLPLDPLPPVVTFDQVAFAGTRLAAVRAPLVGVLATADAGLSWHPLTEALSIQPAPTDTEILLKTTGTIARLNSDLALVDASGSTRSLEDQRFDPKGFSHPDEWGNLLTYTLAHGAQIGSEAVALGHGRLLRAPLRGAFQLHSSPAPISKETQCLSVQSGAAGALFFCQDEEVAILSYEKKALTQVTRLQPGKLLSHGPGAFLTASVCNASERVPRSSERSYCWLSRQGAKTLKLPEVKEFLRIPKRRQSFATWSSGAFRLGWDQKGQRFLVERLAAQTAQTASSSVPAEQLRVFPVQRGETLLELLTTGSLLEQASVDADGFSVWVLQGEKFIGVRLLADGTVDYGALQRPLSRTSFYGQKAFLWGAAGFAKQSIDGGLHFEELALPYRSADPELAQSLDGDTPVYMGCGDAGCALGHLLRRGWSSQKLQELPPAPRRPLAPGGGSRHHFTCGYSGLSSARRREEAASEFEGFWELPPPAISANLAGRSVGFPHDLARLYAYGPRDQSWGRDGRFELRYIDPYDAQKVKRGAPSPHLADNLVAAENLLGTLDRGSSSAAYLLDAEGRVGILLLRTRTEQTLLGFREGEPLRPIPMISSRTGEELEMRNLLSVVESKGRTYIAFYMGRDELAVAEITESGFDIFAQLPLYDVGARNLGLVSSTEGSLGISMDGDSGVFVYPLSRSGELGSPLIAPHRSSRPPSCAPETTGFIVERELPLSPYLETPAGEAISITGLRAKMIVGHQDACLEAMTARVRSLPEPQNLGSASSGVPLTLLNSDSSGNRSLLLCK